MSQPIVIPIEIIESRLFLSSKHQDHLFGESHQMQIANPRPHMQGQFEYKERIRVLGDDKASLNVRVYGPPWEESYLEVTQADAKLLGIDSPSRAPGDFKKSGSCTLQGPAGVVEIKEGVICPVSSLYCSSTDAERLRVNNGDEVKLCLTDNPRQTCSKVVVRVHPTYNLVVHVQADEVDSEWTRRGSTAQLVFS